MLRVGGESKAETHFTFSLSLFFFLFPCYVARGGMRRSKKTKKVFTFIKLSFPPPSPPLLSPRFVKPGKEYQAVMIYSVRLFSLILKKKAWRFVTSYFFFFILLVLPPTYLRRTDGDFFYLKKKKEKKSLVCKRVERSRMIESR